MFPAASELQRLAATAAIVVTANTFAATSPDELDVDFGTGGIVALPRSTFIEFPMRAPDGGHFALVSLDPGGQRLAKLTASGEFDPRFGDAGVVDLPRSSQVSGIAREYRILPDERFVVLHMFFEGFPVVVHWLGRYLPDGRIDTTLSPTGAVMIDFRGEHVHRLSSPQVDPQGRVYAIATRFRQDFPGFVSVRNWIVRLGSSGLLEAQFGHADETSQGSGVLTRAYRSLLLQPDGKLLAAVATPGSNLTVMRFNEDGTADPAFGSNGLASIPTGRETGTDALALQSDGSIVVVGRSEQEGRRHFVFGRLDRDGMPNLTFGTHGLTFIDAAPTSDSIEQVFLLRSADGSLVAAAAVKAPPPSPVDGDFVRYAAVARISSNGLADEYFAGGGRTMYSAGVGFLLMGLDVRPGGEIVLFGAPQVFGQPAFLAQLKGGAGAVHRPLVEARAVEYFHHGFLHYFMTTDLREIAAVERVPSAWTRTGESLRVWEASPGLSPVCRFWSGQAFAPRSSHFYTPYESECASLRNTSRAWSYEGTAFHLRLADATPGGLACPSGTQALYRVYNNGFNGAPNHRYLTRTSALDVMIGIGYTFEGDARTRVFACVPLQ